MNIRKFKKYWAFLKAGILEGFAYKFSAFGWLLGDLVSLFILYFLWSAIYNNSPSELINGLGFQEMIMYLIFARVTSSLVFSGGAFWIVGDDIYEGNIATSLLIPMSYINKVLSSSNGFFFSTLILLFIPLSIVAIILLSVVFGTLPLTIVSVLLFIISIIMSFIIADCFNFLIGQLAIFTNALFGLVIVKNITMSFLSGSLLPSAFFPKWLDTVLNYLPFKSMIETPVLILMNKTVGLEVLKSLLIQFVWAVILYMLCHFTFNKLKKHIVSVGG